MFPRLALLPIGLFLIWGFVCHRWYVCHIKMACETTEVIPPPVDTPEDNRPIVFKWSDADPIVRQEGFDQLKASILAGLKDGDLLVIEGGYFESEPKPFEGFANMGLARAARLAALFSPPLDTARIVESSKLIQPEPPGIQGDTLFEAFAYRTKTPVVEGEDDPVECIEGNNNSLVVLFPYGKSQREVDVKIEECLQNVIEHMKKTDDRAHIVGHTDDAGPYEFNMGLGMRRAMHIQDIIVDNGIAKNRITVESKGESDPVANNDTEEGSRQNRRAVLELIKK